MKIAVASIKDRPGESLRLHRDVSAGEAGCTVPDGKILSPIAVDVVVTAAAEERFLVQGSVSFEIEAPCTRCLTLCRVELSNDFQDEFLPGIMKKDLDEEEFLQHHLSLDSDERYRDDELDLTELLQESCDLAVPMKLLCHDDCQGLCPACGKQRAEGQCQCQDSELDPRLAVLAELLETTEEA